MHNIIIGSSSHQTFGVGGWGTYYTVLILSTLHLNFIQTESGLGLAIYVIS